VKLTPEARVPDTRGVQAFAIAAMGLTGVLGLSGCFSGQSQVGVGGAGGGGGSCEGASCKHGSGGGEGSGTASTGAGSSSSSMGSGASSGSSSGASSSGGSSGSPSSSSGGQGDQLFTCSEIGGYMGDGGFLCGDGGWFASETVDLQSCNPLGGVAVQAIGSDGVPISGASAISDATTGVFTLCVPGQEPVTMSFSLSKYPQTFYQESLGTISAHDIGMLNNNVIMSLTPFFPGGIDLGLGTILVFFSTGNSGCAIDDWELSLEDADGGTISDGGVSLIYMDPSSLPKATLTATSGSGIAVLYNIDTTTTNYFRVEATHPDAGGCKIENAALGYTGRLFVSGGAITYELFNL